MSEQTRLDGGSKARRTFLRSVGAASLAGALLGQTRAAAAAQPSLAAPTTAIAPGTLGFAAAGPGRPKIAMLVHPKMVMQDLVGPLTVFNLMRAEIHLVWKNLDPVSTEIGVTVNPTTLFKDCPDDLDVLFAPGGLEGTIACIQDREVIDFFVRHGKTAKWVTSDCTGALVLGAAGLLDGYKAVTNWVTMEVLPSVGATPVYERVVVDRNRVTGAGATAGLDFGLKLAGIMRGQEAAEQIQLVLEYDPHPPFNAGSPATAPKAIVDRVRAARAEPAARAAAAAAKVFAAHRG